MRRKLLGNDHPDVADALSWLALSLRSQKRLAEAEAAFREALAIRQKPDGGGNPYAARLLTDLGWTLARQGKQTEAETTLREALKAIEDDGDLQAVVVDDRLYSVKGEGNGSRGLQMSALKLVQRITRFRPELDIYILIAREQEDEVVDALFTEAVDGYFYREERDYRGWYRILNAQLQERARTPFFDQLKDYVLMAKDPWHTPGHSSGDPRGAPRSGW